MNTLNQRLSIKKLTLNEMLETQSGENIVVHGAAKIQRTWQACQTCSGCTHYKLHAPGQQKAVCSKEKAQQHGSQHGAGLAAVGVIRASFVIMCGSSTSYFVCIRNMKEKAQHVRQVVKYEKQ